MKYLMISFSALLFWACNTERNPSSDDNNPMKLWYDAPAEVWEEALPIGNGRIGAMVYGHPLNETIQLNEETVWAGEPGNNILPDIKDHLPKIRDLIFQNKHKEVGSTVLLETPRGRPWHPSRPPALRCASGPACFCWAIP